MDKLLKAWIHEKNQNSQLKEKHDKILAEIAKRLKLGLNSKNEKQGVIKKRNKML